MTDLDALALAIAENPVAVIPLTGEVVDLREPAQVALALATVRDAKAQLDRVRADLEALLVAESQRQGTKTLRFGEVEAVVSGGEAVEFDPEQLGAMLTEAGLPAERLNELVRATVTYRVDQRIAKQLASANETYAQIIESCRTTRPAAWRVAIKTT